MSGREPAGIPRLDERGRSLDIHSLRGTAATRLLRHGVDLAHVAQILGHPGGLEPPTF